MWGMMRHSDMDFREYTTLMRDIHPSEKLQYKRAILGLHPERLPLRLVSLGGEMSPVIKVPGTVMNEYGRMVPVIAIAKDVFAGNEHITDVILPSSLSWLPAGAFAGCSSLRNITIPKSIKTIKQGTFEGCTNLENVYFEGTRDEWNSVEIVHDRHEIDFGPLIQGTPVHTILAERNINIPGNEALFSANIHFRCRLEDTGFGSFRITAGKSDITNSFRMR